MKKFILSKPVYLTLLYIVCGIVWSVTLDEFVFPLLVEENITWYQNFQELVFFALSVLFLFALLLINNRSINKIKSYGDTVFLSSPVATAIVQLNGDIVQLNPAFTQLLGYEISNDKPLNYFAIVQQSAQQLAAFNVYDIKHNPQQKLTLIHQSGQLVEANITQKVIEVDKTISFSAVCNGNTEYKYG